jgi:hypothetical protein
MEMALFLQPRSLVHLDLPELNFDLDLCVDVVVMFMCL